MCYIYVIEHYLSLYHVQYLFHCIATVKVCVDRADNNIRRNNYVCVCVRIITKYTFQEYDFFLCDFINSLILCIYFT